MPDVTPTEAELVDLAHSRLRYNAPLSGSRAQELIERLRDGRASEGSSRRVLDIGCGDGRLLLELLSAAPELTGVGLDLNPRAVQRATAAAVRQGLGERARFVVTDVADWAEAADVVVCVGTAHAWPNRPAAFADLLHRTRPGGRMLYGDGFWAAVPSPAARRILGELPAFGELVEQAVTAGWRVLHAAEATLDEHDSWESDWRAGLELSGLPEARALADERRAEYLGAVGPAGNAEDPPAGGRTMSPGYRGVFGFAWLVLTPG